MNVRTSTVRRTEFGQRMWEARKHAKLTQTEAAAKVGVSQGTVGEAEKIGHGTTHVLKFAEVYGCDPSWLARGEGEPNWRKPGTALTLTPPPPPGDFADPDVPTDSEWAVLRDLRVMFQEERQAQISDIAAKAAKARAQERELRERLMNKEK